MLYAKTVTLSQVGSLNRGMVKNPIVRRIEVIIPLGALSVLDVEVMTLGVAISFTYILAVRSVIVTPIFSCMVAFMFHIVGSGNTSIAKSVTTFGIEVYAKNFCVLIHDSRSVVVHIRETGLH
jgi:hypothetical protein